MITTLNAVIGVLYAGLTGALCGRCANLYQAKEGVVFFQIRRHRQACSLCRELRKRQEAKS